MKRLLLVLGLLCACSKTREPEAGSQTHFLNDCDGSCAAPYSCLCGVCTLACSAAAQCADAPGDAACVVPGSSAGSCSAAKLCDVECERNADCSAVGPQFSCEAGRCRETATGTGGKGGGAGVSAAGRGGQGGASGGSAQGGASGGSVQGGASGSGAGGSGAVGGSCNVAEDCVLIPTGCCAKCVPTKPDVEAVLRSEQAAETWLNCPGLTVACLPCAPQPHDPKHAVVRATCVSGQCTVLDLREEPETECTSNDECNLAEQGCCGSCGGDPSGWISVSSGATDPYPRTCEPDPQAPIPACVPCSDPGMPEPFCADDGHCAVREIARVNGVPSTTCYSPTQNVERAYDVGAVGCDCPSTASGTGPCIRDSTGRDVALHCDTHWMAIQDGPCGV